jgi:hypothetical protein
MALEWLSKIGNLISGATGFLNAPNPQSQQIAESLSEDNPYRGQIAQMTGTPTESFLNAATNWEQNKRNYNLNQNEYQLNKGKWDYAVNQDKQKQDLVNGFNSAIQPLLPQIANTDAGKILGAATQYPGVYSPEQLGKLVQSGIQQNDVASAVQGLSKGLTLADRAALQGSPEGRTVLSLVDAIGQNPNLFGMDTAVKTYGTAGNLVQSGNNRAQTVNTLRQMVNQIPDGAQKQMLNSLLPLASQPGMEGLADNIYKTALSSIPQPLSQKEQLQNELLRAQIGSEQGQASQYPYKNALTQAQIGTEGLQQQNYQSLINDRNNDGTKQPVPKASDHFNQLAAMIERYKHPTDYLADLRRNKAKIITKIGLSKYNQLVKMAEEADPDYAGSLFKSGSGSPMRYYINTVESNKLW